jgi:hypothetical protein
VNSDEQRVAAQWQAGVHVYHDSSNAMSHEVQAKAP